MMNSLTKLAIRDAFGTNPNEAIKTNYQTILCPHIKEEKWYADNCELPTCSNLNVKSVDLSAYRLNGHLAIIGQCSKCHKVYYME